MPLRPDCASCKDEERCDALPDPVSTVVETEEDPDHDERDRTEEDDKLPPGMLQVVTFGHVIDAK